jgi:hypothetical protein
MSGFSPGARGAHRLTSPRAAILIDDRIEAQIKLLIETPDRASGPDHRFRLSFPVTNDPSFVTGKERHLLRVERGRSVGNPG